MEIEAQNAIYLGEETGGRGRQFRARFLVPGLVKYDYGVCLLTKENADKFIQGFTGCPVVINHQNVTDDNVKDIAVGDIFSVWFDNNDGYYWCNGIIRDKEAIKLINEGYSVSCQYLITEYSDNTKGALHNGNPYDKVIENGKPEHLAIVNNPRYEGAIIAVNAIMARNEDKWITIHPNGEENKGRHLLLKDGESVEDAMHRNGWYNKRQAKETQKKDDNKEVKKHSKEWHEQRYNNRINALKLMATQIKESPDYNAEYAKETIQRLLKSDQFSGYKFDIDKGDLIKEGHGDALAYIGQIYGKENGNRKEKQEAGFKLLQDIVKKDPLEKDTAETKPEQKQPDKEEKGEDKKYTYTLTKKEVGNDAWLGGMADTGNYYTNGSFAIDKRYLDIKGQEPKKVPDIDNNVKKMLTDTAKKKQKEENYQQVKDFEIGEIERGSGKPIKVAKYSYFDEKYGYTRNIYVDKKYNDLFKNFDLKFGSEFSPIYAYDGKDLVGIVMPIQSKDENFKASNAFVEQFRDTLYTVLAEKILDRLGE